MEEGTTFSTLLIPTDLSTLSERVVECACGMVPFGARSIILLHALGIRHLESMAPALADMVAPALRQQAAALAQTGLPVEQVIAPGIAYLEICKLARERYASVIVLGSRGLQRPERTQGRSGHPGLAARLHGTAALRAFGEAGRRGVHTDVKAAGASYVHTEVAHGSPIEEILSRSAESPESLVVMGTQGRGLLPEVLLGSVSHAVARRSSAPVLLVPGGSAREFQT